MFFVDSTGTRETLCERSFVLLILLGDHGAKHRYKTVLNQFKTEPREGQVSVCRVFRDLARDTE